jgi:hypothetical protein
MIDTHVGHIQGGWPYVWAAYSIAWATLVGYGLSLWLRYKAEGAKK